MAQEIFNVGGAGKTWGEQPRQRNHQKIPSTIKISRTTRDQEIQIVARETIKYIRPTLDLLAILPSSSSALAMDVLVEVGKGSSRKQVVMVIFSRP